MEFLKVTSIEDAREIIKRNFIHTPTVKTVSLVDSLNMVIAKDYISNENIPNFNRSTVDGYAVISSDTFGASENIPSLLTLIGSVEMGSDREYSVSSGCAIYVPTGGMIPNGADAVIMIEDTGQINEDELFIYKPTPPGSNIIFEGDDLKIGEIIIEKGKKISPLDIGILASSGLTNVEVTSPLSFFIISMGDELVKISDKCETGKVRDINSYIIEALLKNSNSIVTKKVLVKDDFNTIKNAMSEGINSSDCVIISGGSSAGKKDYTLDVIKSLENSEVYVHGLSLKPGKPTIMAKVNNKPIFGLPGHPVSAVIVFKLIVEYYINQITKNKDDKTVEAIITSNVHSSPGKHTCQTVRLFQEGKTTYCEPTYGKSGLISLLSKSHGYIEIPMDIEGIEKDEKVNVHLL